VISCVCGFVVSVCPRFQGKRLELSTPNSVDVESMVRPWHANWAPYAPTLPLREQPTLQLLCKPTAHSNKSRDPVNLHWRRSISVISSAQRYKYKEIVYSGCVLITVLVFFLRDAILARCMLRSCVYVCLSVGVYHTAKRIELVYFMAQRLPSPILYSVLINLLLPSIGKVGLVFSENLFEALSQIFCFFATAYRPSRALST